MEGGTSVLDSVPANKVLPAPVLPRLPLHLLKKSDDASKVAAKSSVNLERSKSLKVVKDVSKEGRAKDKERRKSDAVVGKVSDVRAGGGAEKGPQEKMGGHGKVMGKGLASLNGLKLGSPVSRVAEADLGETKAPPIHLLPDAQPSTESAQSGLLATESVASVPSENSMRSSEPSSQMSGDVEGATAMSDITLNTAGVESSFRDEPSVSEVSQWGSNDDQTQESSTSVSDELSGASAAQAALESNPVNKPSSSKPPLSKVKSPVKGLPASRFAREAPQPIRLPEAQFSMSKTLDWDSDQDELVMGQGPTSLQSADFLDGALSRFADLKLQYRNPLHKQRLPPALLAKQRGVQEGRFGRPPSARSELGEVLLDGFVLVSYTKSVSRPPFLPADYVFGEAFGNDSLMEARLYNRVGERATWPSDS